jgi:hypothetical protein
MTCGPGPSCIGWVASVRVERYFSRHLRARARESFFKRGSPRVQRFKLPHFLPTAAPFRLRALRAPLDLHFFCRRSSHGLSRPSRVPPVRGGTQLGAQHARMGCSGVRRKDPFWHLSPRQPRRRGAHVPRLQPPLRVGAANLVFLRAAARGTWPPTSALHAPLHPPGGHRCLPLRDVRGGDASSASARTKGCCAATFQRWKSS